MKQTRYSNNPVGQTKCDLLVIVGPDRKETRARDRPRYGCARVPESISHPTHGPDYSVAAQAKGRIIVEPQLSLRFSKPSSTNSLRPDTLITSELGGIYCRRWIISLHKAHQRGDSTRQAGLRSLIELAAPDWVTTGAQSPFRGAAVRPMKRSVMPQRSL